MSTTKRGRGRPPGTGLNDVPTLSKVADMLLANPRMKPTTAIVRVLGKPGPSTIRRLQEKWKVGGPDYLAEARRAAEREAYRRSLEATIQRQSVEAFRSSRRLGLGATLDGFDSPAMKAIQEALNSPAMRAMRELQDSPAMRAMRELHDSPAMRAMRELQNSPVMRAAQEAMNSPAMRALQEQMERARILSERLQLPRPYS